MISESLLDESVARERHLETTLQEARVSLRVANEVRLSVPQKRDLAISELPANGNAAFSLGEALKMRRLAGKSFSNAIKARQAEAGLEGAQAQRRSLEAAKAVREEQITLRRELSAAADFLNGLSLRPSPISAVPSLTATAETSKTRGLLGALQTLRRATNSRPAKRRDPRLPDALLRAVFDAEHYLQANGLALPKGMDPLDHYLTEGRAQGLSPHPLLDVNWIARDWPRSRLFDLVEYLVDPALFAVSPHPLFDAAYYLAANSDVAEAGANPLAHYLLHGWREGRAPNRLFDSAWYLAHNPDVLTADLNPLVHLARHGLNERRSIHPLFDHAFYLEKYPDVAANQIDPYVHYVAFGYADGRVPGPAVEKVSQLAVYFENGEGLDLLLSADPFSKVREMGHPWPPRWDGRYWLPQALRNFIIERFGEGHVALYTYLFSVIERYAETPAEFDASDDCQVLFKRARLLAAADSGVIEPTVSVIIPVYNNLLYTLTSVVSVLETAPGYSFEIIVADDGSTDQTAQVITAIGGIVRYHRNRQNIGFLKNCNAAAEGARGEFLVFLNNDTIALPSWLDQLIAPFEADARIGFTGSKLLNGDGTLQEAGGVFWEDGSAWNFGRNSDPLLPEFNYLKDVDYVSGASIAIPRSLWRTLGGFDELYSPAYCEDSDIAFRIRQAGYRTVYAPHSPIVHHEGRSHGRDVTSGIKAYQVINQEKFVSRWGETLRRDNFPNGQNVFLARDRSRRKPHILIVDHYVPQWDRDAGSRTLYLYIKMFLDMGFAVTFWPDNLNEDREYTIPLQNMGVEVIYTWHYVGRFGEWLAENGRHIDYAFLSRPHVATKYLDDLTKTNSTKIIYYGHDLHYKRLQAAYNVDRDFKLLTEAKKWEGIEMDVCSRSNVVLYPGEEEVEIVRKRVPAEVNVINFPITIFSKDELEAGAEAIDRGKDRNAYKMMFVGGFSHAPNVSGVVWFVRNVMPLIVQAEPRFHLSIAGSNAPGEIKALAGPNVSILGRISDDELENLYAESGLAVVPLLYGGGVKGKVIEAMAKGVPVVMTGVGAQGIPDAESMSSVEDDPLDMARVILASALDRRSVLEKSQRALAFIDNHYSTFAVRSLLCGAIPELTPTKPGRSAI